MTHIYADRVADSTLTTGTGALTLDAPSFTGYQNISDVCSNGDTIYLTVAHPTLDQWEVGQYTYGAGTGVLTRTVIFSSSNADAAVNFSSGPKSVIAGMPARSIAIFETFTPPTNDGASLGALNQAFSDLFLASGSVINWNAGDATLTHSSNALTFNGTTLVFSGASRPGNVIARFDTGASDLIEDFYFNLSNTANPAVPTRPNPVMQWAYNLAPGGGRVSTSDTAFGFGLEGNYIPTLGTEYNECHLYLVNGDGQHRPWSWRINKTDYTDWGNLIHITSTIWFQPTAGISTDPQYAQLGVGSDGGGDFGAAFSLVTDSLSTTPNGIQITGGAGGTQINFDKTGPDARPLAFSGFSSYQIGAITLFSNGVYVSTAAIFASIATFTADNADNSAVTSILNLSHTTSGTPGVGIGVGITATIETSASNNENVGTLDWVTTNVGSGTEAADLITKLMTGGAIAEVARMTSVGNYKIGGTAARGTTEGTNQLVLFNGTAPVGTLTNGVSLYSASGEMRAMDAAGNSSLLSPHDQVTNEWIYHSIDTRTGKGLRVDMERMMRAINERFGWDFVHDFVC